VNGTVRHIHRAPERGAPPEPAEAVRGVSLNHLVGTEFGVGEAVCRGTELCEPCSYLERHLESNGVRNALVHRGGLRCRILDGGRIRVGDGVETLDGPSGTDKP